MTRPRAELLRLLNKHAAEQDRQQLTPYARFMDEMSWMMQFTEEEQALMCATPEEQEENERLWQADQAQKRAQATDDEEGA